MTSSNILAQQEKIDNDSAIPHYSTVDCGDSQVTRPDYITENHWKELVEGSGISTQDAATNFKSITGAEFKAQHKGAKEWADGWIATSAMDKNYYCFKPDGGYLNKKGNPAKYCSRSGDAQPMFPNYTGKLRGAQKFWEDLEENTAQPIAIIESQSKKLFAPWYAAKIPTLGINGVWGWSKKENESGIMAGLLPFLAKGRTVYFMPDGDVVVNKNVRKATLQFLTTMETMGVNVLIPEMPHFPENPEIKAIDDLIAFKGIEAVKKMLEASLTSDAWKTKYEPQKGSNLIQIEQLERYFGKQLRFNIRSAEVEFKGRNFGELNEEWVAVHKELEGGNINLSLFEGTVLRLAKANQFDPVRDLLDSIPVAKGLNILPTLAKELFGESVTDFENKLFIKWLVSCYARIYQPGCRADSALVLQGAQGLRKTSFFRAIAIKSAFFKTMQNIPENKDDMMILQKNWIVELGEIETSFSKADIGAMKSTLSETTDSVRRPYEKKTNDVPRRTVFGGTANTDAFLNDPTGSRRFWVIPVTQVIPIEWLEEHIEKVWSEVAFLYESNKEASMNFWELSQDDMAMLAVLNQRFEGQSSSADSVGCALAKIKAYLDNNQELKSEKLCFTASQIAMIAELTRGGNEIPKKVENEIGNALKKNGWEKTRAKIGGYRSHFWYASSAANNFPRAVSEEMVTVIMTPRHGQTLSLEFDDIAPKVSSPETATDRQVEEYIYVLDNAGSVQETYQAIHAMKQDGLSKEQRNAITARISDDAKRLLSEVANQHNFSI